MDDWIKKMWYKYFIHTFYIYIYIYTHRERQIYAYKGFPGGSDGKESACNAGDLGLISGLGRSPGEGKGNPLQDSGLETCLVHGVAKTQTRLCDFHFTTSWSVQWVRIYTSIAEGMGSVLVGGQSAHARIRVIRWSGLRVLLDNKG